MSIIWFWLSLFVAPATADKTSLGEGSYTCDYIDGLYRGESWMIFVAPPSEDGTLEGGMEIAGAQLAQMVELKVKRDEKSKVLSFHAKSVEGFGPIPEQVKPDEVLFQLKEKKGKLEFIKGVVPDPLKCTKR